MMTSGSQSGFLSGRSQVLFSPPLAGRTDADAEKGQDFVSGFSSTLYSASGFPLDQSPTLF